MKIYKGEAGVTLTLENFLDLLEEDALEDIIDMVLDLEMSGSITGQSVMGDFDGDMFGDDVVFLGVVDLSDFDGDIESLLQDEDFLEKILEQEGVGFTNILDFMSDDPGHFDELSEDDFNQLSSFLTGDVFLSDEDLLDNLLCSNEDLKVKRIVQRFHHILDAQK